MAATATQEAPTVLDQGEVPNAPKNTGLYISARVIIHAPAEKVFRAATDLSTWPAWNSFVPSAVVTNGKKPNGPNEPTTEGAPKVSILKIGDSITMQVRMKPEDTSLKENKVMVTEVTETDDKFFRVCWGGKSYATYMLKTLRTTEVLALPDAADGTPACEVRTWEVMDGILAAVVKSMYGGALHDRFLDFAKDLKDFTEKDGAS